MTKGAKSLLFLDTLTHNPPTTPLYRLHPATHNVHPHVHCPSGQRPGAPGPALRLLRPRLPSFHHTAGFDHHHHGKTPAEPHPLLRLLPPCDPPAVQPTTTTPWYVYMGRARVCICASLKHGALASLPELKMVHACEHVCVGYNSG